MTDDDARMRFALAALATWRISHLLACEDGPADAVLRLRTRLGDGQLGKLADCFACTSVWVAAPLSVTVARGRGRTAVAWFALSGAACLLQGLHADPERPTGGTLDGMLWPGPSVAQANAWDGA